MRNEMSKTERIWSLSLVFGALAMFATVPSLVLLGNFSRGKLTTMDHVWVISNAVLLFFGGFGITTRPPQSVLIESRDKIRKAARCMVLLAPLAAFIPFPFVKLPLAVKTLLGDLFLTVVFSLLGTHGVRVDRTLRKQQHSSAEFRIAYWTFATGTTASLLAAWLVCNITMYGFCDGLAPPWAMLGLIACELSLLFLSFYFVFVMARIIWSAAKWYSGRMGCLNREER